MSPRIPTIIIGAALASAAAAPAAQAAPFVAINQACYFSGNQANVPAVQKRVVFTGGGYSPGAKFVARARRSKSVTIQVAAGTVAQDGTIQGAFTAPRIRAGLGEQAVTLEVRQGTTNRAEAFFAITKFSANFFPATGSSTTRVKFQMFGFGPRKVIYLHYLRPNGTVRQTVRLGKTVGSCGRLITARRPVFPFRPGIGRWRLQFDLRLAFSRVAQPRVVISVPIVRRAASR